MVKFQYFPECQVPLCGVDQCRYKICRQKDDEELKTYKVKKTKYLKDTDKYWADFLKSQEKSSANYIYKIKIYGDKEDRTQFKKEAFPTKLIHQRLLHMPVIAGLDKRDLHYLLSFILNLVKLDVETQTDFVKSCLQDDLLDMEILNYIKILARHPTTGLKTLDRDNLLKICSKLLKGLEDPCDFMYFNPDHIFSKSLTEMDPYELEYLKDIRNSQKKLDMQTFFYLVNFVERLQEMNVKKRDQYLRILNEKGVLPSPKLGNLLDFMIWNSKKINHLKLRVLLGELEKFMDIDLCTPRPLNPDEEVKKKQNKSSKSKADRRKLKKMLASMKKGGGGAVDFSNIDDMKSFLKDLMDLSPEELEKALRDLMASGALSPEQLKLIQNMIKSGELGGDPAKAKLLMQMLDKANEPNAKGESSRALAAEAETRAKLLEEIKAKTEAEAKAKAEEEAKVKDEAEAKAKAEAEAKAKTEADTKAKAKAEADAKFKAEAEAKAETKARVEAEMKAKFKAEAEVRAIAKAEAEAKAKAEAEVKAMMAAEAKAKAEAEAKAKSAAEDDFNIDDDEYFKTGLRTKNEAKAAADNKNQQREKGEIGDSAKNNGPQSLGYNKTNDYSSSGGRSNQNQGKNNMAKEKSEAAARKCGEIQKSPLIPKCVDTQSFLDICPIKQMKRKTSTTYRRRCCLCTCDGMIIYP